MPRTAPKFAPDLSDECFETLIEFVLHYEYELLTERKERGRLTGHGKSQLALLRRMLSDMGIDLNAE